MGSNVAVGFNQVNGNRRSGIVYSTDGGAHFTDMGGLPTGSASNLLLGDPSLAFCGDGNLYFSSILTPDGFVTSQLAVSVGTFSGGSLSWSNPLVAVSSAADFLDKEWIACDRARNILYLTYTRSVNGNVGSPTERRIEIVKSADGGATWNSPVVLASSTDPMEGCYVVTGPGGEVYTLWERGINNLAAPSTFLEFRRSFDFAATFDPKVVVRTMVPSFFPANVGYNRESTLEIGTLAVDASGGPHRGNLYAIWVEREAGGGATRDVFSASSSNQGTSWSAPVRVNDDPPGNDQVMPWLSVNGSGTVEAAWYDYRNWAGMYTADIYAARSRDGGISFSPNFRVTSRPSSWFAPYTLTPNFGDYLGTASEGNGFYLAWSDSRNNDIDVFTAHLPTETCGNGVLDPFEQCDDGNTLDGDSCSGACASTPCGNGILEAGEACDDGNVASGDGCSQSCALEICGDGIVQRSRGEDCDDGNLAGGDGCSSTCQIELDRMAWVVDLRSSRLLLESIVTGRAMPIGDSGFHEIGDLAFDAAGRLFGSTGFDPPTSIGLDGVLVEMAPQGLPGRASLIGHSGWPAMNAIDFHPLTGQLYGIAVDSGGISRLVTLDPASGATLAVIGDLGLNNARAMAFDAAGTLFVSGRPGSAGAGNLYTVNLASAVTTLVGTVGAFQLSGMDFAPDGTLYGVAQRGTGADGALVQVSRTTGAGTVLFNLGPVNQQGIRFAPAVAVDHDLDGIHDAADCAPLNPANPPPGLAGGLLFSDGVTFYWTAAPDARFHNAYRGTITAPLGTRLPGSPFDHTCFESADSQKNGDLVSVDPAVPPLGTAFYYVTGGEGCGDGPLDSDPSHPIPNLTPCPTPP
jgi:cysteine-rich repeat protein